MAITSKTNRIDIRLTDYDKTLIEKAADYNRQSISSYIISVVIKQAKLDIENNETLSLSNEDRDFIMELLNKPQEPNASLVELFKDDH